MEKIIEEKLPSNLINLIKEQYGEEIAEKIFNGYLKRRNVSFRVNTLKASKEEVVKVLNDKGIKYDIPLWYEDAFVLKNVVEKDIECEDIYEEGKIYLQNLSSMLPPILLEPKEKNDILDMTAAPGGKTTEIAALTNNKAYITACEKNKVRADRLRYNLKKQGVNAYVIEKDATMLDSFLKFDQILLDAPCSGSGTIILTEESEDVRLTDGYMEKLEKVQTKLLDKAITLLKSGEEMVYSTCSILYRENEHIVNKFLKANRIEIVPIDKSKFIGIEFLPCEFEDALLVMPNENYEGLFAIKIRKK